MRMIQGESMEQGMRVPVTAGAAGIGLAIRSVCRSVETPA